MNSCYTGDTKTKLIIAVFPFENKFPSFFSPFVDRLFGFSLY